MPPKAIPKMKQAAHRGTNTYLPKGRNQLMTGFGSPSYTAARAVSFFMIQKNMIPAVSAPKGQR